MIPHSFRIGLLGASLSLLGACSTVDDSRFPSLAKRPIESAGLTTRPDAIEPPPAAPADSNIAAKIAQYRGQANTGQGAFQQELGAAQRRVSAASGAAVASDAWMEAQMAISGLDSARAPTVEALASLDQLQVKQQGVGGRAGMDEIAAAIAAVRSMVAGQDEELNALKARLRKV